MQETDMAVLSVSLLDLPVARLQIVQANDLIKADWLDRSMLEPTLSPNADGLWLLSVRRQGEHSKFEVPFIGSEIVLADAELGLVVVLVGYHGSSTEKYGRLGYLTQKGQFYRYYQQQSDGDWKQVEWRFLCDELRQLVLNTVEEQGPAWAKKLGKLQADRKPPTKRVALTSYKVVRLINGRYFSLYDPTQEYILGQRVKEPAKPKHGGGFYSYPTFDKGTEFLVDCVTAIPFHREVETSHLALLECEIGGRIIDYGHKLCSTYLCPIRVLEVREIRA
jgi:hypothetical protein